MKKFFHNIIRACSMAFAILFRSVLDVLIMVTISVFIIAIYVYSTTPDADYLVTRALSQTTVIYDRTGEHVLYEIHGEENRKVIPHEAIPNVMRAATLAAEDDGFFEHSGIDILSIMRAVRKNIIEGQSAQGASTITQQLVRNAFLSREKTYQRKFKEVILSFKVERAYSKNEILDFYLNEVPYGSNAYGIQSAAEVFFGKSAHELTLDEAAFISALPKATTYYSPYGNHTGALVARQRAIITRMGTLGFARQEAVDAALEVDTLAKVLPFRESIDVPHFVFYVKEFMEEQYGRDAVERGGFRVYTTLDYDLQKSAEEIVREGAAKNVARGATNASLVALDPKDGDVLAMVGSVDYFNKSIDGEVNVALRPRQPGSSFKPFAYAAAFDQGFQPETVVYDLPTNFGVDGSGKAYKPNNYDGRHHGLVSLRKAISGSLNVPAVKALYLAGIDNTIDMAESLGITTLTDRNRYGLALVLGGGEVKLLEEVSAFGTFANDGMRHEPNPIAEIRDSTGEVFYSKAEESKGRQVINAEVARKVNSILSDYQAREYVFGRVNPLSIPGRTVAAKTGTTQEFRDAWTVGYTPSIAVGVWVGNNDNTAMSPGSAGAVMAAPIWRAFMDRALQDLPAEDAFTPYTQVTSDKPMLTGNTNSTVTYFNKKTGEQLSEEKLSKISQEKLEKRYRGEAHTILHYINREDPLGNTKPDRRDPMYHLWERSLRRP